MWKLQWHCRCDRVKKNPANLIPKTLPVVTWLNEDDVDGCADETLRWTLRTSWTRGMNVVSVQWRRWRGATRLSATSYSDQRIMSYCCQTACVDACARVESRRLMILFAAPILTWRQNEWDEDSLRIVVYFKHTKKPKNDKYTYN